MNGERNQEFRSKPRLGLPYGLQFSLFELFAILLFAGVGAAALREGGATALVLVQTALWVSAAMVLVAIFSRKSWQAFAVGFLVGVAIYVGPVLYVGGRTELDPHETKLLLTQPALALFAAMGAEAFVYEPTGERFDAFTTEVNPTTVPAGIGPGQYANSYTVYKLNDGRVVTFEESPPRAEFMLAAHALFAIASGYVFGQIATVVYRRRKRQAHAATVDPAS